MQRQLYLASSSYSRQYLLKEAGIPFIITHHTYDESQCPFDQPVADIVTTLADQKMNHASLPHGAKEDVIWVVSADTLSCDLAGQIYGKPDDYHDAVAKVRSLRDGASMYTGFCVERKRYVDGAWRVEQTHTECVESFCIFDVSDAWLDTYFSQHPIALKAAGAMAIEQYGLQFLKKIEGSYTGIIGLPLYEVRQALDNFGFFTD